MNAYRILVKGIVKKDDRYLIVEKWYDDNIMDPYQWEFLDGEAEFGESPDVAVVRMIQEQTGLTAEIDRILYTWTFMVGSTFVTPTWKKRMCSFLRICTTADGYPRTSLEITSPIREC